MMKRIFVPTVSGSGWQRLLGKPNLHWKRGYSAMSTAACWEASNPRLPAEIVALLECISDSALANLSLLAAFPEWEVELPGGERASQTDVLALCRNDDGLVVIGVEAKVNEPFGPTLGEKRADASTGQSERIAFLERELGCATPMADSIRYQLLHRTVSALLTARAFHASAAIMLIQSFSPVSRWREDFDVFVSAVGGEPLSTDLFELASPSGPRLLAGWCKGDQRFLDTELPSAL